MDRHQGSPLSFRDEGVLCPRPGCFRVPSHAGRCVDYCGDPLPTFGTREPLASEQRRKETSHECG